MEKQVDVLERIVLEPGASVTLPNVTLEVQLPNSYDMRSIDFGFSLSFVTADGPGPVDPPGPTDSPGPTDPPGPTDSPDPTAPPGPDNPDGPVNPPKTGDTSHLNLWLAILGAAILLLGFVLIKMRNERHQP